MPPEMRGVMLSCLALLRNQRESRSRCLVHLYHVERAGEARGVHSALAGRELRGERPSDHERLRAHRAAWDWKGSARTAPLARSRTGAARLALSTAALSSQGQAFPAARCPPRGQDNAKWAVGTFFLRPDARSGKIRTRDRQHVIYICYYIDQCCR